MRVRASFRGGVGRDVARNQANDRLKPSCLNFRILHCKAGLNFGVEC